MRRLIFLAAMLLATGSQAQEAPNVLFIAVDDLRPELQCYGSSHIVSPHMDRLAESGVLFEQAYCMVPTCGASRASMMSGIRPARNRFVNYLAWAEKDVPGVATLNTHFRSNGYHTVSLGKVFHHAGDSSEGWSEKAWRPTRVPTYQLPESVVLQQAGARSGRRKRGPAWEAADVADSAYRDGVLADRAVKTLGRLKQAGQPFFLAVGFLKPHLPFVAPQRYWDLYDREKIGLPPNYHPPEGAPRESLHTSGELRAYAGIPAKGPVSEETARSLIHGYYACVSYTDAQIGKVLDELERLELSQNTIVVLWGDHGWNLGEHTLWCKHSCYETSMRIPLIIRAPQIDGGQRRSAPVESIDLYPTLCELARIPKPDHLEGQSLAGLMGDPNADRKAFAIGRFKTGDTIRTSRFRFTEFTDQAGRPTGNMLYDHASDPGEDQNVAEKHAAVVEELERELHQRMGKRSRRKR